MSRLRFGPTAALPLRGSTSSGLKRINSSMSLGSLQRVVEPLRIRLEEKQRQFDEFLYRANNRSRRVIVKVEVDQRGINRRFVVTNRDGSQSLYDHYTNRGQTENFIKAFKNHLSMDRLSCHRFLANQFRLLLHALAYQMFVRLRDEGPPGTRKFVVVSSRSGPGSDKPLDALTHE